MIIICSEYTFYRVRYLQCNHDRNVHCIARACVTNGMFCLTGKIHSYPLRHEWKDCRRWYWNLWGSTSFYVLH